VVAVAMEEREVRLSKLEQLKQLGIDPFGVVIRDVVPISKVRQASDGDNFSVMARVTSIRQHGNSPLLTSRTSLEGCRLASEKTCWVTNTTFSRSLLMWETSSTLGVVFIIRAVESLLGCRRLQASEQMPEGLYQKNGMV